MKATFIQDWTIGDICKGFRYNESSSVRNSKRFIAKSE